MKIQITDRKLWLDKVLTALQAIEDYRDTENTRMDALPWYRRISLGIFEYPSMAGCDVRYDLVNLKRALESEGTGDIYVGADELRSLEVWL